MLVGKVPKGFKLLGAPIKEQIGDPSFVFLLVQRSNRGVGEHDDCFEGLVLKRLENDRSTRVGYARWYCSKADFEQTFVSRFAEETMTVE